MRIMTLFYRIGFVTLNLVMVAIVSGHAAAAAFGDVFLDLVPPVDNRVAAGDALGPIQVAALNVTPAPLDVRIVGHLYRPGMGPDQEDPIYQSVVLPPGGVDEYIFTVTVPSYFPFGDYVYRVLVIENGTNTLLNHEGFGVFLDATALSAAEAKLVGEAPDDYAGRSVSSAGDVNGDGFDDLLVGALGQDAGGFGAGAAYLVYGPVTGTVDLSAADAKLVGEAFDDVAGYSVSSAGDVNGDGFDDLLVGADGQDAGGGDAGAAYLVLGPVTGTVDLSAADAKLVGETQYDWLGKPVSSAGDVNGDGFDDLLVGAAGQDEGGSDAGAAYVVFGPVTGTVDLSAADAKLVGEVADDWAGWSVSSAGDVNGDGFDDLVVGASGQDEGGQKAGAAYLVLGPVTGTVDLSAADAKLVGEASDDYVGSESISSAGDVNGDGFDDLLVGAWGQDEGGDEAGAAYLVLGGP